MKLIDRFRVNLILATDNKFGISREGVIPWNISEDMQFFRTKTSAKPPGHINVLIVGRKTWEQMGSPIEMSNGRKIIVMTLHPERIENPGVMAARTKEEIADILLRFTETINCIWVCGGKEIYKMFMSSGDFNNIYWNKIESDFGCDNRVFLVESVFETDSSEFVVDKKTGKIVELIYYRMPEP